MSDEQALLAAIFAHPEEDTPRLVYADWLDEQGGESNAARAEYIRLEIEHARNFPERQWSKEKADAQKRASELFAKHHRDWFGALYGRRSLLRGAQASVQYRRGFPYEVYANNPAGFIAAVGEALLRVAPITDLILNDIDDHTLSVLLNRPWLSRLRSLQLSGYDEPATLWFV